MADGLDPATLVTGGGIGAVLTWLGKTMVERWKHRDDQANKLADRTARITEHYDKATLELLGVMRTQISTMRTEVEELAEENMRLRRLERRFGYVFELADATEELIRARQDGVGLEAAEHHAKLIVAKVRSESTSWGDAANELQRRQAAARLQEDG